MNYRYIPLASLQLPNCFNNSIDDEQDVGRGFHVEIRIGVDGVQNEQTAEHLEF